MNKLFIISMCIIINNYAILSVTNVMIMNKTSGQATVTIYTSTNSFSSQIAPNENQYLNDVNDPNPKPTIIPIDNDPIKKIVINRIATNFPQIIYVTADDKTYESINNISLRGSGLMYISLESIDINGTEYALTDLNSFITQCNSLQSKLSEQNDMTIEKEIEDMLRSLETIKKSDKAQDMAAQIMLVEMNINTLKQNCNLIDFLQKNIKILDNIELSVDDSHARDGSNQPVASNINQTQDILKNLINAVTPIIQFHQHDQIYDQAQALMNKIKQIQSKIEFLQPYQSSYNKNIIIDDAQAANYENKANQLLFANNI